MPNQKATPEPAPPPDPAEAILLEQLEKQREEEAEMITREEADSAPPGARGSGGEAPIPDLREIRSRKSRLMRGLDEEAKPKPPMKMFPPPFTANFHPDHKDPRGRPMGFWEYWKQVYEDPALRDRVVVYIYRLWPVMVEGKRQVTKAFAPFPYEDILKLFGCGDYFLKMNDAGASKKMRRTICNCKVTMVGNYSLTEYPPLLDLEGLDTTNPHNERYVQWCESRGIKVPGREETEEKTKRKGDEEDKDVSEVTKILLNQYTQLADRLMKDERKTPAPTDPGMAAVAPMVAVIQTATEGANKIMQKAYERTAELQQQQQNPTKLIAETVGALKDLLPKPDEKASEMVSSYLTAMREMSNAITKVNSDYVDKMVQMTNQRLQNHEDQMKALLEAIAKRQEASAAAPPPAGQPQSLKDMLREMAEFKDQLRDVLGVDDDKPSKGGWTDYLPDILKAVTILGTTFAAAMHNFAVAKTGQGQPVPVQPMMPSSPVPPTPPPPAQATADQQQTQQQEQQPDMMAQYHNLLSMLRPSLLKSFMDGENGADYAERLIELTDAGLFGPAYSGRQIYDAILEAGEMSVATVIKTFPPIWDVVRQTPQKWERFLHEFFTADQIWAAEDAAEQQQAPVANPVLDRKKKT